MLENTRETCRARHRDTDIEKRMQDNGWTIQKLESFEIVKETNDKIHATKINITSVSDVKTTNPDKTAATIKPMKASKKISTSDPLDTFVVPS